MALKLSIPIRGMTLKIVAAFLVGAFAGAFAWEHLRQYVSRRIEPSGTTGPKEPDHKPEKPRDWRDLN